MRLYCVVYKVYGIYYRYRCAAITASQAKAFCKRDMLINSKDIVEAYRED